MKRLFIPAIALIIIITAAFALYSFAADEELSSITSVTMAREKDSYRIDIKASLTQSILTVIANSSDDNIYLFEVYPYQRTSKLNELTPVAQQKASSSPSFTVAYQSGSQTLYAKYLLAYKLADGSYSIVTGARYIDNPELVAANTYDYPVCNSKKGLAVQLYSDAQELGTAHTVINVPINDYILTSKTANSLQYTYGSTSYYVNRDKLDYLDYRIKTLTESGVHCYINLMLTAPDSALSDGLECMYFTDDTSTGAALYGFNTTSRDSVLYLEAFVNFLAQRYTAEGGSYGFAGSFIVGYQVNSNRSYNYMGEQSLDSYLNYYCVAFRIVDTALRSVYSNGRTYISLAGNFNTIAMDTTATIFSDTLDYTSRDTLDAFAAKISYAGDIPWRVAISARPSDVISTDFTADALAVDSFDTPYISMNNIDTFCDYMAGEALLYKGEKRSVTVSFGISAESDSTSLLTQAAMYALAYYKAEFNPDIESLIYYRHVDNSGENGNFGLWTSSEAVALYPEVKKPIYDVFRDIDTDKSLDSSSFALSQLNISGWKELVPSFNENALTKRVVIDAVGVTGDGLNGYKNGSALFSFTGGSLNGFTPSDNVDYFEFRENGNYGPMLYCKGYYVCDTEYMGVGLVFDEPMSIKNSGKMSVVLQASTPASSVNVEVMLRLFRYSENGEPSVVYEGVISDIVPDVLTEVGFDISSLVSKSDTIDGLKIWLRPTSATALDGDYSFYLKEVSIYSQGGGILRALGWIGLIILFLVVLVTIYIIVINTIKGIRRKNKRRRRVEQPVYSMPHVGQRQAGHNMPGTSRAPSNDASSAQRHNMPGTQRRPENPQDTRSTPRQNGGKKDD